MFRDYGKRVRSIWTDLHPGVNPIGGALWLAGAVRVLSRWSSGDAVLVQKAAELIDALDLCRAVEQLS
jgi:hypothetical protein